MMHRVAVIQNLTRAQKLTGGITAVTIVLSVSSALLLPRAEVNLRGFLIVGGIAALYTILYYGTRQSQKKGWLLASDLFYMPAVTLALYFLGRFAPYFFYLYFLNLAMDAAIYDWRNYRIAVGIILASMGLGQLFNPSFRDPTGLGLLLVEWAAVILMGSLFWLYAQEAAEERAHRQHAEEETKRFAELEQAKSDFLALASHEMRTPLGHIKGYVDLLREKHSREALLRIDANVDRLLRLIAQMLSVLKLEDQHMPRDRQPVELFRMLRELREEFLPRAQEKQITLTMNLPHTELTVAGSPLELREAVANLIDNTLRYTQEGGTVNLSVTQEGHLVTLQVKDTGIGVPRDEQKHLFQKFFRATNARAIAPSGSGLGLYLVKRIIEQHGGTITLSSRGRQGTTVTVTLPAEVNTRHENPIGGRGQEGEVQ